MPIKTYMSSQEYQSITVSLKLLSHHSNNGTLTRCLTIAGMSKLLGNPHLL